MRRLLDKHSDFGAIWTAYVGDFRLTLTFEQSFDKYDGEDENGETQAALDSGELVMFDSKLSVNYDGMECGTDYLGSSVYKSGETSRFIRDGYFRDMLREACDETRLQLAKVPQMRGIAA